MLLYREIIVGQLKCLIQDVFTSVNPDFADVIRALNELRSSQRMLKRDLDPCDR